MTSSGTVLVTGGLGQTSSGVAKILASKSQPFLIASRKGQEGVPPSYKAVKFDWADKLTWTNPFEADSNIRAIYLVTPPSIPNLLQSVKGFIDFARERGVKRFVLLSESQTERGDPATGTGLIYDYVASIGVEWAVLRPTWFMENFDRVIGKGIKEEGLITTATNSRKIGFIAAEDIARFAVDALTDEKSHDRSHLIFGPELLSYDDAADIFTEVLGKKVVHKNLTEEERIKDYINKKGFPEPVAKWLTNAEVNGVANGLEEKVYEEEGNEYGVITLRQFVVANKERWL